MLQRHAEATAPRDQWRDLEAGEVVQGGDERWNEFRQEWQEANLHGLVIREENRYRRRIRAQAPVEPTKREETANTANCGPIGEAIEPADQWRMLEPGEIIQAGDEWRLEDSAIWNAASGSIGMHIGAGDVGLVRRRVTPATPPEAKLPLWRWEEINPGKESHKFALYGPSGSCVMLVEADTAPSASNRAIILNALNASPVNP